MASFTEAPRLRLVAVGRGILIMANSRGQIFCLNVTDGRATTTSKERLPLLRRRQQHRYPRSKARQ